MAQKTELYWIYEDRWREVVADIFPKLSSDDSVQLYSASLFGGTNFLSWPDAEIISQIHDAYDSGKRTFVFECMREGLIISVLTKFTRITNNVNLPNSSFIWLTGDPNGEKVANERHPNKNYQVLGSFYFEYLSQKILPKYTKEYIPGLREKRFLCLNKIMRQSRIDLLEFMLKQDLVKDAFYSFLGNSGGTISTDELVETLQKTNGYPNIVANKHLLPLQLSRKLFNGDFGSVDLLDEDIPFYENSYFSVVTETIFYDAFRSPAPYVGHIPSLAGTMITEKTYKPIAMKHPFILLARPFTLRMLQERGYKTFSPFIDESYDEIVDDTLRLKAVADEINRLSKSDLVEFTYNIKDIVEHNEKHFWNQTVFDPNKIKAINLGR
jgi:hypothetical protein